MINSRMRDELTWLLIQQAGTVAHDLRGSLGLARDPDPDLDQPPPSPRLSDASRVVGSLDQLDEVVRMLATLLGQPIWPGRRGRVDIGALLWELAAGEAIQVEQGATLFGDESELRRMLRVLLAHRAPQRDPGDGPAVIVRRGATDIAVTVDVGFGAAGPCESERLWLAQMAARYGGQLEVDGTDFTLLLATDEVAAEREGDLVREELAPLEELAAAEGEREGDDESDDDDDDDDDDEREGEREGEHEGERESEREGEREGERDDDDDDEGSRGRAASSLGYFPWPPLAKAKPWPRPSQLPRSGADGLAPLVAAARVVGVDLRTLFAGMRRDLAPFRRLAGDLGDLTRAMDRHVDSAADLVAELGRLGACPIGEPPRLVSVTEVLREALQAQRHRLQQREVRIGFDDPGSLDEAIPVESTTLLLELLLTHAVDASPPGSEVGVALGEQTLGGDPAAPERAALIFLFDDRGAPVPEAARDAALSRDVEALTPGRPRSLPLIAAHTISARLGFSLSLTASPRGGARARLVVPRAIRDVSKP